MIFFFHSQFSPLVFVTNCKRSNPPFHCANVSHRQLLTVVTWVVRTIPREIAENLNVTASTIIISLPPPKSILRQANITLQRDNDETYHNISPHISGWIVQTRFVV